MKDILFACLPILQNYAAPEAFKWPDPGHTQVCSIRQNVTLATRKCAQSGRERWNVIRQRSAQQGKFHFIKWYEGGGEGGGEGFSCS